MLIGINASAALKENSTGVEEYVFQMVKHLAVIPESRVHRFVLYLNPRLKSGRLKELEALPENFQLKFLNFPFGWTQIRLAWEMINSKVDVLFIPAHILPLVHPKKSIVALHGLEYEYFPELYPFWHRVYLCWSTKYALKKSAKVIAVSKNTKNDLVKLYGGAPDKISVIYHGINQLQTTRLSLRGAATTKQSIAEIEIAAPPCPLRHSFSEASWSPRNDRNGCENHILYIGRLELKKNILGIIEAYNKLRQKNTAILNKLILVGGKGFGFEKINKAINSLAFKNDIILKGYAAESEKNDLLKNSAVFLFPSFYEGFGLPALEAQAAGVPVIASNTSCLPEIAGQGAVFIDPKNSEEIASALEKILSDKPLRQNLIQAGLENVKKFSWEKCARETLKVLESI